MDAAIDHNNSGVCSLVQSDHVSGRDIDGDDLGVPKSASLSTLLLFGTTDLCFKLIRKDAQLDTTSSDRLHLYPLAKRKLRRLVAGTIQ
jgi:hypothetical protein